MFMNEGLAVSQAVTGALADQAGQPLHRWLNERIGVPARLPVPHFNVIKRIGAAAKEHLATAALIKPNQVGTVTETLEALAAAREAGWGAMISHRSGETTDTFIADLAVAAGVGQRKIGAPARGERGSPSTTGCWRSRPPRGCGMGWHTDGSIQRWGSL
jgi:enolase